MADLRTLLTDKTIAQLPAPDDGWYLARDTELKGFFVVVGKRKRTFTVQGDLRKVKRVSSIRVSIGDTSEISTRTARATAKEYLAQISRGQHPRPSQDGLSGSNENAENKTASTDVTFKQAWQRYLKPIWLENRSEKTIAGYRDHVERIFAEWLDAPLRELGAHSCRVAKNTTTSRSKTGPISRTGRCGTLAGRFTITRGRRTKSFRPIILQGGWAANQTAT